MQQNSTKYWIGINMNPAITPARFHLLLNYLPSVKSIWKAPLEKLKSLDGFQEAAEEFCDARDEGKVNKELERCRDLNLDVVTLEDEDYPESLRAIDKPPPVLYVKGDYEKDDQLGLAMVGTRKNTNYGKKVAKKLASQLAREGLTLVSGMARGIDTYSHKSALGSGGRTVAVMGTGFGHTYPKDNANLMRKISENGAVITEFPFEQRPTKWTFPQRNRIISGLTRGTIVVEAPESSGALITAHDALSQGREVFAVPGDVRKPTMKGTHGLIKDGAKLVEDASDVVEEFKDIQAALPFEEDDEDKDPESSLNQDQKEVYSRLEYEPIHFNDLVARTDFSPARLSHIMFQLEMENLVEQLEGNKWVKSQ
ncbi:MAG: DNA-processing protein DprA [Candidatus Bipolaricaulota bacterium]|nr:DNA-processing protein DprA [Candidatus Bipolaricaulota bacterium]MBS3791983.1 DNA-processing protein DprA [Candidatus Bipolaricaulota bacterium]